MRSLCMIILNDREKMPARSLELNTNAQLAAPCGNALSTCHGGYFFKFPDNIQMRVCGGNDDDTPQQLLYYTMGRALLLPQSRLEAECVCLFAFYTSASINWLSYLLIFKLGIMHISFSIISSLCPPG